MAYFLIVIFFVSVYGCSEKSDTETTDSSLDADSRKIILKLNGTEYTLADYKIFLSMQDGIEEPEMSDEMKSFYLEKFIEHKFLLAEAGKNNVRVTDEELENKIAFLKNNLTPDASTEVLNLTVENPTWQEYLRETMIIQRYVELYLTSIVIVTNEEEQEYFDKHYSRRSRPRMYKLSQIKTNSKDKADEIKKLIKRDGSNFSEVARAHSSSPDSERGGAIGWYTSDTLPDYILNAVKRLRPGNVSDIIETDIGFLVLKLEETKIRERPDFYELKDEIQRTLLQEKREKVLREHINKIWKKTKSNEAGVEIYRDNLDFIYRPVSYQEGSTNEKE